VKKGVVLMGFIIVLGVLPFYNFKGKKEQSFATEKFIAKWLTNDNGTLATYIKDGNLEDIDLVKGRESLSESLGLWMEYALEKEDQSLFNQSYTLLKRYFLESNGFVNWKVTEMGQSDVFANALVDDLRICSVLFQASEKWSKPEYEQTAIRISNYLWKFNVIENTLTDYYVKNEDYASEVITLSYIEPVSLVLMENRNLIDARIYQNMFKILKDAPMNGSFYPKAYDVKKKKYLYDTEINLIDQALVALYRAKSGYSTEMFFIFVKREFEQHSVLFGQYDRTTEKSIVTYESPALYGWLILYSLEVGDEEFAEKVFKRMIQFKSNRLRYYGGYSIYQGDTHIFDNLVPILAELKLMDVVQRAD